MDEVKVWEETVKIPTYEVGEAQKNPISGEEGVSGKLWQGVSLSDD